MKFSDLQAIFFDFDGVILDSTSIKTETFKSMFKKYGDEVVNNVIDHHLKHGGISRVEKIKYYHEHFLNDPVSGEHLTVLAEEFSSMVKDQVVAADWISGAESFLKKFHRQLKLYVISGTPQSELLEIVNRRCMTDYFQEVLGSPTKKPDHVRRILGINNFSPEKCIFVGDALTDLNAARETGTRFIGIQGEVTFPDGTIVLPDCKGLETEIKSII